jgi:hypothetical protein
MSDTEQYQVLYRDDEGRDALTDPQTREDAEATARAMTGRGVSVGSVMTVAAARGYVEYMHGQTYRGVPVPPGVRAPELPRSVYDAWRRGVDAELDGPAEPPAPAPALGPNPFKPDLSMSRDVADFVLRAMAALLDEGCELLAYTGYGPNDWDGLVYDEALVRRAADIVGRDRIEHDGLRDYLRWADADAGKGEDR